MHEKFILRSKILSNFEKKVLVLQKNKSLDACKLTFFRAVDGEGLKWPSFDFTRIIISPTGADAIFDEAKRLVVSFFLSTTLFLL